jgi:hypothetical protein
MDFHKNPVFWEYDVIGDDTVFPAFSAYQISDANSLQDKELA